MRPACGDYGAGTLIGAHDGGVVEVCEFNRPEAVFATQLGSGTSPEGIATSPLGGRPEGTVLGVSLKAGTGDSGGGTIGAPLPGGSALGVARTARPNDGDAPKAATHEPLRRNNTIAIATTISTSATKARKRFI